MCMCMYVFVCDMPRTVPSSKRRAPHELFTAVKDGYLMKRVEHSRGWKRRYCVVQDCCLYYYKSESDSEPLGVLPFYNCPIERADDECGEPYSFSIVVPDRVYYFYVSDSVRPRDAFSESAEEDVGGWISALCMNQVSGPQEPLCVSGFLTKQGGSIKTWKRRFCLLDGLELQYFKSSSDSKPIDSVDLTDSPVSRATREMTDRPNTFAIERPERTYLFSADTPDELNKWIRSILFNQVHMHVKHVEDS